MKVTGFDGYNQLPTGDKSMTLTAKRSDFHHVPIVFCHAETEAYGWYPQMKAEGIAWTREKATTLTIGTNPGFQNGVVIHEGMDL